jgi:hypothetical protein
MNKLIKSSKNINKKEYRVYGEALDMEFIII